jgi:EAL domain-containing protein (putative c-di-GMP-specific phosphodiesterase class I)
MGRFAQGNETSATTAEAGTASSARRMLVIDDDPFTLKLMRRILARQGFFEVTACASGQAALETIDGWDDGADKLILCDLNMPEMDGVEFVRRLAERKFTGALILISGEDDRVLQTATKLVRAHNLGILGYLRKPIASDRLRAMIEGWNPAADLASRRVKQSYAASQVHEAIARGEFVNVYQPKVEIATGKVVGVETLVRWQHPVDGLVFPDRFVSVAEENGLIDDLTRVVLSAAFAQARRWKGRGLALRVAVNVSMDNLTSLDFPDFAAKAASEAGIEPRDAVLEVTEGRLMKDPLSPLDVLTRLRLKGFGLSIDDFGTGYSSLAQLRDLPFDELKVDRSFVHGAHSNDSVRAIFEASRSLARQLGLKMVAEGVEDRADWDFLCQTGCDMAQGYHVAKPMAAADIAGWIAGWEAASR